jgi:hypothetical protein
MAAILVNDFVVIEGDGKQWTKADLIKSTTDGSTLYEDQEDTEQSVRVFGETGRSEPLAVGIGSHRLVTTVS